MKSIKFAQDREVCFFCGLVLSWVEKLNSRLYPPGNWVILIFSGSGGNYTG